MKVVFVLLIIFILIILITVIADTHRFVIRHYDCVSDRVAKDMRLILACDLHNRYYGPGNSRLLEAIDREHPDAVLIAGDLVIGNTRSDLDHAVEFVKGLTDRYEVYYGFGNHESKLKESDEETWKSYTADIQSPNLHMLDNERIKLEDEGIDIAGLSLGRKYYKKFSKLIPDVSEIQQSIGEANGGAFQILIAHNPDYFDSYAGWGADLTVSGHIHGGIMRLPGNIGVISPRFTLFPKYSGGEYEKDAKKMIVSCGLGMHTINIRVFNPGELTVIDIHRG